MWFTLLNIFFSKKNRWKWKHNKNYQSWWITFNQSTSKDLTKLQVRKQSCGPVFSNRVSNPGWIDNMIQNPLKILFLSSSLIFELKCFYLPFLSIVTFWKDRTLYYGIRCFYWIMKKFLFLCRGKQVVWDVFLQWERCHEFVERKSCGVCQVSFRNMNN